MRCTWSFWAASTFALFTKLVIFALVKSDEHKVDVVIQVHEIVHGADTSIIYMTWKKTISFLGSSIHH